MRVLILLPAVLMQLAPRAALAHAPAAHEGQVPLLDPWLALALVGISVLYGVGFRAMRQRSARLASRSAALAFAAGIVSCAVALCGPVDRMADQLFAGHMVQHLTLMLVAAPLLVAGRVGTVMFRALPLRARRRLGRALGPLSGIASVLSHPASVWFAFVGIFVFWHVPGAYAWAYHDPLVHDLEHVSFLAGAFGFWSVVIEPVRRRRLSHGASALFVGSAAVVSGLPGALMILAPRPLYQVHGTGPEAWGLTALQDQQLGGLIMWIPGGFAYLLTIVLLLFAWLRAAERRTAWRPSSATVAPLLVAASMLVVGCEDDQPPAAPSEIGDPALGAALIAVEGCGSCHIVPGIEGAEGLVGPPLYHMSRRIFIAGLLRNTPDNMVTWLRNPQAIVPGNAMPDMGLTPDEARHITAYLYTLE